MNDSTAESSVRDAVRKNGGWLIALGLLTVILGFLSISMPFFTGISVTIFVGAFVLVEGISRLVCALKANSWGAGLLGFLGGLLPILAGVLMIAHPLLGLRFLTLLLVAYFLVDGISRALLAFKMRPLTGWGWTLFSGIVGVLLAIMIWRQWPLSGAWAVGTLVGIHILFGGWSTVAAGLFARRLTQTPA